MPRRSGKVGICEHGADQVQERATAGYFACLFCALLPAACCTPPQTLVPRSAGYKTSGGGVPAEMVLLRNKCLVSCWRQLGVFRELGYTLSHVLRCCHTVELCLMFKLSIFIRFFFFFFLRTTHITRSAPTESISGFNAW